MRATLDGDNGDGGRYFQSSSELDFISTGCRLLDCAVGGGWPLTRISNIVGDFGVGKTLVAIEATNSFAKKYARGKIRYAESEAAFDQDYAASISMPIDRIQFSDNDDKPIITVEDFYEDLKKFLADLNGMPGLYILDTLDALSAEAEIDRKFNEGSYGTDKARQMSKLFRMCAQEIKRVNAHLMVISQERDNIGVTFGKKSTRSGGRALDFYASQIVWLAKKHTIEQTINKVKRATGLEIRAKVEKNKISVPLRTIDFSIRFNYGIDDLNSCLDWLEEVGHENEVLQDTKKSAYIKSVNELSDEDYWKKVREIGDVCATVWMQIEEKFKPERKRV